MARILAAFVVLLLLAGSAPAQAPSPRICARYTRQIDHYEGMLARAQELGNEMWEERMLEQVARLEARAEPFCPELAKRDETAAALAHLMKLAGRAALSYFTFGAF